MNLVKQIQDQLSGGVLGQLSSALGTNEEETERAASAAVPSLLAALAGMSSSDDGAKKLSNTLGGIDPNALGNIGQMLSGNSSSLLGKGTSMLSSLFGDGVTTAIANTVSRFTGINAGVIKSLLAYLLPLVLAKVAGQWKSQGGNAHALKNLFAEQRSNINSALPSGLSLADIPGIGSVTKAASNPAARKSISEPATPGSPARWLLPLGLALLAAFVLWQYFSRRNVERAAENAQQAAREFQQRATETGAAAVDAARDAVTDLPSIEVPTLEGVTGDLGGLFTSLNSAFSGVRDAASAERAIPSLRTLNTEIDSMSQVLTRLPETSRLALRPVIDEQVKIATERANAANAIEGIGAEFKALIQEIISKIARWISADTN